MNCATGFHRVNDSVSPASQSQARASGWLAAWDGQGIHRTASVGGRAGAAWLTREAAALGAAVTIEEFALDRLDPTSCFIEFGVRQIVAVPVFDAPATDEQGVAGRLWGVGSGAASA